MTTTIPTPRHLTISFQGGPGFYHTFIALLLCALLFLAGCAGLSPGSDHKTDSRSTDIMNRAQTFNSDLTTSKGTGRLELTRGLKTEHYKLAWAAKAPNQLRMTLLMSGHPVETIAANGRTVTFVSHTGSHKPHSTASADPDLNSYIDIPVRLSEMVRLFLGQIPVRSWNRAWTETDAQDPKQPDTVFASARFSSKIQEISLDENGNIVCFRLLDKNRNIIFSIRYSQFFERNGFILPGKFTIKDKVGREIKISFKNLIPNIPVKESVFRLTGS